MYGMFHRRDNVMGPMSREGAAPSAPMGIIRHSRVLLLAFLVMAGSLFAGSGTNEPAPVTEPVETQPIGWGTRLLWYVPNRLADTLDMVRARVRVGPGLAAGVRVTDYGAFYAGRYHAVYAGLPGPRRNAWVRSPLGYEELHGIVLAGVDATDSTRYGPVYSPSELNAGLHLLMVGADVGFDPIEIWDFLAGWLMLDPRGDDYPRDSRPVRVSRGALAIGTGNGVFRVDSKPDRFDSCADRLDYLQHNVYQRFDEPIRRIDSRFALPDTDCLEVPKSQVRMGLYSTWITGADEEFDMQPMLQIDAELPNLENRLRIFVETRLADDLPGRDLTERAERGFSIGVRQWWKQQNISWDVGARARVPPKAYTRLAWKPRYALGDWIVCPEQRFFYETDEGLGELTMLSLARWLGDSRGGIFQSRSSGKWTRQQNEWEWEQSVALGWIISLLDENRRGGMIGRNDMVASCGIRYALYGREGEIDAHRLTLDFRGPLYGRWIHWQLDPGVEWRNDNDFDMSFRVNLGIDLLFSESMH